MGAIRLGFVPTAGGLMLCGMVPSALAKALLLTAAMALSTAVSGGALCNHLDISTRLSGILFGVTNTCATITGICGVRITGSLIEMGFDWSVVFDVVSALWLAAAACFLQWGGAEKVFE